MTDSTPRVSATTQHDLEVLSEEECKDLLANATVGRLALQAEDGPEIFPVNFAVHEGAIAIWTGVGRKLSHAAFDRVAFEVDRLDEVTRTGWVVEVRGHAEDITDAADPTSVVLRQLPVDQWVNGAHEHCLAIARPRLSGRRLVPSRND